MLAVITLFSLFAWAVSAAITVAFYMGLAYLGGKLFGPDIPESDTGETPNAQSRSWNPRSTQREGIARPRAWGKNSHHGNIVAKWTDVDGDDREVLHIIVEHGDGPTKGVVTPIADNVFLNDQPAGNFGSVDIQERVGTMNQTVMTGFEKTKLEYPIGNELEQNEPIIFTTHNDFFDDIEYTIMWPNGLHYYQKSGKRKTYPVTIKVRIREHPSGGWTEIFNAAITANTLEPYFKLYKVSDLGFSVVRGTQYDLEFTRTSGIRDRSVSDVYLKSCREVVDAAFTRPGKALVGIRAIATAQLSGNIDVKIIREDRLINVWNGSTWSIEYSRNRSWVVFDAFTQPVIDGDGSGEPWVIDHYEGLDPSRLDLAFFLEWASFCSDQVPDGYGGTEDRIACDTILDFQTSVWKFANELANVGRASLYWQGFLLTGWVDKVVGETTALVTMDNVMARSWANQWVEPGELAGRIEVFFNDSRQGYERTPASLPNESAGKYTKIISIEGIGVTTRGTAIHVANHALKRNELIRNINNFRQYKDAFRYHLGDVLRIQHRTPDWGVSYRVIKSTANNKVTLDRVCDAVAGELLYLQSYDESLKKVRTDSYTVLSVSDKVVTIVETWDVTPLKNYMVAVGVTGETKLRRIIKIDSTADNYFDITVETYDTDLFDADLLDPNNPDQNYIWGTPANPLTRPVTRDDVIAIINSTLLPQLDIDSPSTSNCTWDGNSSDTISWSKEDADEPIQFRYKGTTHEITPDSTTDEFVYWDPNYTTTFRTTNDASVAVAMTGAGQRWMMCRNIAGVAYPTIPFSSIHAGIIQAGTIIAAQIIIGGINALALMNAPAEAGADVTGGHQGDISLANLAEKSLTSLDDKSLANLDSAQNTKLNEIEPGADVTGDRLALIASSMLPNWRLDVADLAGRPAGIYPVEGITNFNGLDWLDSDEAEINIAHVSDTSIAYGFPAIPIDDKQKYAVVIRHKAPVASAEGLYLRIEEYDAPLPAGKTHIGAASGGANVEARVSWINLVSNGPFPGTSWQVDEYIYTPTAGTKYASFSMYNWTGAGTKEYHVDYVLMFLIPKTADEITGAVSANVLALIASSILPNWRLDIEDTNGRPAGIYPTVNITDFDQLDWLDSGKAEIKILSVPLTNLGYGFPAIPIDDKQKYKIVIRHKSSAASADGLYLYLREYNLPLPVGKTHIGFNGGSNAQQQTSGTSLVDNAAMPGTSWVIDEYTYTPAAGTKYASLSMQMVSPDTAGVEYHVDYVLMFLIPKTADEIPDGDTYKQYSGTEQSKLTGIEPGANVTGDHQAASIFNQGNLAVLNVVGGAQIDNLAVDTLHIQDQAVTVMVATFTAAEEYWSGHQIWREVQTITIETTGAPIMIIAAFQWRTSTAPNGLDIRIQRDNNVNVYSTNLLTIGSWGNPFCVALVDEPSAGEHTYDIDLSVRQPDTGTGWIRAKNRSLVNKEVKK